MKKNIKWLLLVSLIVVACNNDDSNDEPAEVPVVPGTAVFTKYVALGDSFAAGYSDGALFAKGQSNAYTNILSQQFAAAGGGAFTTPFMLDNTGGFSSGGVQIPKFPTRFVFDPVTRSPVNIPGVSGTAITARLTGTFNNMGVPGAKSFHLLAPGYGNLAGVFATPATANPYFARFSSSPTTSILADAMAQAPTFFSLFIGGNDVLGYATNGGVPTSQDPVLGDDITPTATFNFAYNTLVNTLTSNGAKGVVANLPYITTLPHFTTVPYNPLTAKSIGLENEVAGLATIKLLNAQLYGPLKAALTALGAGNRINLLSETSTSPLLMKDETLPNLATQLATIFTPSLGAQTAAFYGAIFGQARQAKSTDLILLTTKNAIGKAPKADESGLGIAPPYPLNAFGISFPLQDKHILIPTEIAEIRVATDAYNTIIAAAADAKGLAFVDTRGVMTKLSSGGIRFGNFTMTSSYAVGGAFSLDGVHPSPRGYGLIANIFIDAINAKYGSTLRHVDLGTYPIQYPLTIQ